MSEWQPIETAPQMKDVLLRCRNEEGRVYVVIASFTPRFTIEAGMENYENCEEYNEEKDQYFALQGWYEQIRNWPDYTEVFINDTPTHWMLLPSADLPRTEE